MRVWVQATIETGCTSDSVPGSLRGQESFSGFLRGVFGLCMGREGPESGATIVLGWGISYPE